jgi:uncharacterized small protein (DUF1192 family)
MPDDEQIDGDPEETTSDGDESEETTSEDDAADDADEDGSDAADEDEESDEDESESDDDEDAEAGDDEDDPEFKKLLAKYMAKGRTRKEALALLTKGVRETDNRSSQMAKEIADLKAQLGKKAPAEPEPKEDAKPEPKDEEKPNDRLTEADTKLKAWSTEFDEIKARDVKTAGELSELADEIAQKKGAIKATEDQYAKERLESQLDKLEAKKERLESRHERDEDKLKSLAQKYHSLKAQLPEIKKSAEREKAAAEKAAKDQAARVEKFGRTWESSVGSAFKTHRVPEDKGIRQFLDQHLGMLAHNVLREELRKDPTFRLDVESFITQHMEQAIRHMRTFSGSVVKNASKAVKDKNRRAAAGPRGEAARATPGRKPKSDGDKKWSDYMADARRGGL